MSVVDGGHVGDDVESRAKIDVTHELALIRSALTVAPFDLRNQPFQPIWVRRTSELGPKALLRWKWHRTDRRKQSPVNRRESNGGEPCSG